MSTTNNAVNNQTGSSANSVFHSHIRAASGKWHNYNDQTDQHGYYSGVGSPEGVVAADTGSIYSDTGAGANGIYYKTTDTVNTGWVVQASGATFSVVNQTFTANGTYTPTVGMQYCTVEVVGGGGAGGGAAITAVGTGSCGAGGGGGEYAFGVFSAATIGVSQAITIGAGGVGVAAGAGGAGGTTSIGALMTAVGGAGGLISPTSTSSQTAPTLGGNGGAGGSYRSAGWSGNLGFYHATIAQGWGGVGGNSYFGAGGIGGVLANGAAGLDRGSGGGGAFNFGAGGAANRTGGAGTGGIVIVAEYVIL